MFKYFRSTRFRFLGKRIFDYSRDVAMAIDFMAKFGYMRSLGRAAFENGLQYRLSLIHISEPTRPY